MPTYYPDPIPQDLSGYALKTDLAKKPWIACGSMQATFFYRPIPGNVPLTRLEFEYTYASDAKVAYPFHITDFVTEWTTNGFYTGNATLPDNSGAYSTGKEKFFPVNNLFVSVAFYPNNYFIINVVLPPSGSQNGFIREVYANGVMVV